MCDVLYVRHNNVPDRYQTTFTVRHYHHSLTVLHSYFKYKMYQLTMYCHLRPSVAMALPT